MRLSRARDTFGAPGPGPARPVELTIVVQSEVRPRRYPPRRELWYGEWLCDHRTPVSAEAAAYWVHLIPTVPPTGTPSTWVTCTSALHVPRYGPPSNVIASITARTAALMRAQTRPQKPLAMACASSGAKPSMITVPRTNILSG